MSAQSTECEECTVDDPLDVDTDPSLILLRRMQLIPVMKIPVMKMKINLIQTVNILLMHLLSVPSMKLVKKVTQSMLKV